ncbi:hypothetical protein FJZ26_05470 [Candidatus Parvarchaeota archaeon]|nr:hypothetical protein [Candidatus Parvarchaeota archaeon]
MKHASKALVCAAAFSLASGIFAPNAFCHKPLAKHLPNQRASNRPKLLHEQQKRSVEPAVSDALKKLSDFNYFAAIESLQSGKTASALSHLSLAIAANPGNLAATYEKAKLLYSSDKGQIQESIKLLSRLITLLGQNPDSAATGFKTLFSDRAMAKSALGDKQGAIKDLEHHLSLHPDDSNAREFLKFLRSR